MISSTGLPTAIAFASSAASSSSFATTTTTAWNTTATTASRPGAENGECKLLGPFALFIQGALGLLALLSLVFKRWRERPQRPVKIWAFDASKQVVGSSLLHVANLLMSMVSSGELKPKADTYQANPCSFYLLNLAIDTTLGIPVLIFALRILTYAFLRTPLGNPPESIQSGNYGHPPKALWWLKQCFIYFLGLLFMKICVFVIFQLCPWIIYVGDWALRWTEGDERVQIFFVMLFFPVVMNALQYYIIDSFIKDQKPAEHGLDENPEDEEEESDSSRGTRRRRSSDVAGFEGEDEAMLTKDGVSIAVSEPKDKPSTSDRVDQLRADSRKAVDEYNPEVDGASSSSSPEDGKFRDDRAKATRDTSKGPLEAKSTTANASEHGS